MTSRHWIKDRANRDHVINEVIGIGKPIKSVVIDKGHKNGAEIHTISTTGIIIIRNEKTGKMITKLIARPGQLKRFWSEKEIPTELKKICREHKNLGYNYI